MDPSRPELPALCPGALVAGCRLEEELGRGAMGVVWRGLDLASGRPVAVKLLLRLEPERRERFAREAALMAGLEHPGIVRLLRASPGDAASPPALVMELVPGTTLGQVLRRDLPLPERLLLVEQVARAVQHAHSRGVVHRDLKPENVLVGADGQVRVADFGLGRDLTRATRLTQSGWVVGTPMTMAPEVVRGDKHTGPAADVYSLGAILYQALTGGAPYEAESLPELFRAIEAGRLVPPSRYEPALGPDHDQVCARALAVDPARRQRSAGRLAEEVRCLRLGLPLGRADRERRRWLGLAGAGLGAVALALAGAARLSSPPADERAEREEPGRLASAGLVQPASSATGAEQDADEPPIQGPIRLLRRGDSESSFRVVDATGRVLAEADLAPLLARSPYPPPPSYLVKLGSMGELDGRPGLDTVLVFCHERLYPALVVVVDGQGQLAASYWHPGHLGALLLRDVDRDGVREIFLGGTNNDLRGPEALMPVVMRLDARRMSGEAPPRRGRMGEGSEDWYCQLGEEPGSVSELKLEGGHLVAVAGRRRYRVPLSETHPRGR